MTHTNACKGRAFKFGWGRLASLVIIATALLTINSMPSRAQTTAGVEPAATNLVVPTTKLLAIGSFTTNATPNLWKPILVTEARETLRLYLAGKIDQWYVKQDQSGVVFVMNVTDPEEAHELLGKLPLGRAGLMEFQFIPLGPISPLRLLLSDRAK